MRVLNPNVDQPQTQKTGRVVAISFHKFIDRLNRSGLLTTKELQALLAEAPKKSRPGDAESLAHWLVKRNHLTPFQAKAIFLGHTKGLVVGNYVILDLLGVGGMGQVYKAQHRRMKRIVALKLLSPEVAKKPKLVARFHQEVEAAAKLMHPNIVTAFDADEADGKHFLVMEYVPGRELASIVRERGRLSVDRSIRCILDAARGLEYAHRHGVVHRDVKPSNLLMMYDEDDSALGDSPHARVKILDMGLARIEAEAESLNKPSDLTRTGIVMGTVDYMSPEQAVNTHEADHRSDIYSLGITLHFLVTGSVPYKGRTVIEQVLAHREAEIPSMKADRNEVPSALDAIFQKMVAKQPGDRYQSMSEVVRDLEAVLSSDESDTDLPIVLPEDEDDALTSFLESMSGSAAAKQQAAAAVITPSSSQGAEIDTIVASDRSTTVGTASRFRQRKSRPIPWGPIVLHLTWSLALLGGAIWMLLSSRDKEEQPHEDVAEQAATTTVVETDEDGQPDDDDSAKSDTPSTPVEP